MNKMRPSLQKKTIVFFDIDHTLIPRTSAEALFIKWLVLHGRVGLRRVIAMVRFFFAHLDDIGGTAMRGNKMYLKGVNETELEYFADRAVHNLVKPRLSERGIEEIKRLKYEGNLVVLLSASPAVLVKRIHEFLGTDDYIATSLETQDGMLTGIVAGLHPYGERKTVAASGYAAKTGLPLLACGAYANASSDLPLLKAVGRPVAVNPDGKLMAWAKTHGWPICYFT